MAELQPGAKKEKEFLHKHLTNVQALKPSTVLHAAWSDLCLRDRKLSAMDDSQLQARAYAFDRRHVARAASTHGLIRLALSDRGAGMASGKLNTRRIYGDEELLRAALAVISGGG